MFMIVEDQVFIQGHASLNFGILGFCQGAQSWPYDLSLYFYAGTYTLNGALLTPQLLNKDSLKMKGKKLQGGWEKREERCEW